MLFALNLHGSVPHRIIGSSNLHVEPDTPLEIYTDGFGNTRARALMPPGQSTIWSDCILEMPSDPDPYDWNARQHEIMDLPADTLVYLLASRYCESDALTAFAWQLFSSAPPGWARVQAISNWVHNHIHFDYRFGRPTKTAADVMREGTGVCRDFAHLFVTLCRAMNIPARYASGYLSDIGAVAGPGDFCAWAEAYLEGRWHVFDARHNTPRIGRILMVRGRDAADVAMITSFGDYRLNEVTVWTDEVEHGLSEDAMQAALQTRPNVVSLVLAP